MNRSCDLHFPDIFLSYDSREALDGAAHFRSPAFEGARSNYFYMDT